MQVRPLLNATKLSNYNTFIIMSVMIFVIVLSMMLATVVFMQNDELYEDDDFDDFFAIGGWIVSWTIIFNILSFALNLESRFHIVVVVAQYLRSHIGEKRIGDWTIESNNLLLIPDTLMTVLFKAVIYFSVLCFYQIHVRKLTNDLFPISRIHSTLFGELISTQGGTLP